MNVASEFRGPRFAALYFATTPEGGSIGRMRSISSLECGPKECHGAFVHVLDTGRPRQPCRLDIGWQIARLRGLRYDAGRIGVRVGVVFVVGHAHILAGDGAAQQNSQIQSGPLQEIRGGIRPELRVWTSQHAGFRTRLSNLFATDGLGGPSYNSGNRVLRRSPALAPFWSKQLVHILFVASEVAPFAKTGGLADVSGTLPAEIGRLGVDTTVIMPAYRQITEAGLPIETTDVRFAIRMGGKVVQGGLLRATLPGSDTPIYFVDQPDYFHRPELYGEGQDYPDNCERFTFFCRAALETIRACKLDIDVVHCNDWQTGLIPAYLKIDDAAACDAKKIRSVFTIHNLAYQGVFWHWDMLLTGIDWKYFNWRQMEFHGQLSLIKTGIVFADWITTVSERYAAEIQTPEMGLGLEGELRKRRGRLSGILNGVDYAVWNPRTDPHLPKRYDVEDWREGKAVCKAELQREMGLPVRADVPLLAQVGRLADQKGWDLMLHVVQRWVRTHDAQWVFLGDGQEQYHKMLKRLSFTRKEHVAARLEFSDPLAHRIEAGADIFVMPSHYEPCGLNQLYSLRYGTPPVVRSTGGLADTICDANSASLANSHANGFAFEGYDALELESALQRACDLWKHRPDDWDRLVTNGMRQDWSWTRSAREYVRLYQRLLDEPAA